MSTKKIDEALGINSIDEFLSDLKIDDSEMSSFSEIDSNVKRCVDNIDGQIAEYNKGGIAKVDIANLDSSLGEIRSLIETSKDTIRHIHEQLVDSELIDSELVSALSKLLEATHLTISEYINLFKDRQAFYDKVRLEMMKHQNKKELMERKHQMDLEKLSMTKKDESNTVEAKNMVAYSQEDITKMINSD